ncbi:hypothetical protein C3E79_11165 [Corynebacterium liangguodongii]|uniref:Uncharacterized protein n=1 Tax=Corynebacterium liangguodongii TaxID=2079535 RepID=A0A2S0WHI1_9CORY|nr:hypothetical protein C3E79_11165 [Corynebacterium liangguodongii]PWB99413.1 hypothetical protein DF219_07110 [Corynebacterium liangguodongii]
MRVGAESLGRIHRACAVSTFWELDPLAPAYSGSHPEVDKGAWLVARAAEQPAVGVSIVETNTTVGAFATVLVCPTAYAPGAVRMPTAPMSRDAWALTSLHIDQRWRGRGFEAVLLDAAIAAATDCGAVALEAFGLRPGAVPTSALCEGLIRDAGRIGLNEVPALESAGFRVVRDHPVLPRLRVELPPPNDALAAREVAQLLAEVPAGG